MIKRKIEKLVYGILNELNIKNPSEINLEDICNYYGINLELKRLENNIAGFYVVKNNLPYIVCNSTDGNKRKRFTIAHELGHHFLHKDTPLFVNKKGGISNQIFHRDEKSQTGEVRKEREANAFAASLLMPQSLIEKEINNIGNIDMDVLIDSMAKRFNVSSQAMTFRLANLGYNF